MTKTYQHTFRNGHKVTLTVDFDVTPIKVTAEPSEFLHNELGGEYQHWLHSVLIPDLMNFSTPAQVAHIFNRGMEEIKKHS